MSVLTKSKKNRRDHNSGLLKNGSMATMSMRAWSLVEVGQWSQIRILRLEKSIYPRDVFVRYGGLHRTAAEVVFLFCVRILPCIWYLVWRWSQRQYSTVSGMEAESETAGAEFSVSKAKLFPTQTNTTDYKLRLPPTPAQHFTIQHIIDSRNISKKWDI